MKINSKKSTLACIILIFSLCTLFLTSCKAKKYNTGKINVTAATFPIYDWLNNLSYPENNQSDPLALNLLIKNGVDMHSYQPTANDFIQISQSRLFVYTGGESDEWIYDALENNKGKNILIVRLMDVVKERLIQEEDEEDHEEFDEHIWLSVKNAELCCKAIYEALCQINPENTDLYTTRFNNYLQRLQLLDAKYESAIKTSDKKEIIICDRFPFRYLMHDYNIAYTAAFEACSSETEASFEKIATLTQKVNEISPKGVLVLENSDKKLANSVIHNSKHPLIDIYTINSMQGVTLRDAFNGKSYISLMEKNLENIQKVLK